MVKACKKCGSTEPKNKWYCCANCGRTRSKLWAQRNRSKIRIRAAAWRAKNRAKTSATSRAGRIKWEKENPEKHKRNQTDRNLRFCYGVSAVEIKERLSKQTNVCAVCGDPLLFPDKQTHVDHDHKTGKIRGVLCRGCNVGIGCFRDSPARLTAAARYLEAQDAC